MIYKIADLFVEMDTWGKTLEQAKAYEFKSTQVDIKIDVDCKAEQKKHPACSLEICEYLETGFEFYRKLLSFDGMMIHASAIMMDGYAYLFSASSGTGKSTHTNLWKQVFGKDRAQILNDDKPAVRFRDGKFFAYGTPWSGKTDLNINTSVPIGGICILERGKKNEIEPFSGIEAIFALYSQTVMPRTEKLAEQILEIIDKVITNVPIWRLRCNMDPEAAIVAYEAMSGEKWRAGE